jgi:hypothetical protein
VKIRVTKTRKGGQSVSKHQAAKATRPAGKRIRTKPDRARAPVVSAAPTSDQKRPTGKLGHVLDAVAAIRGASLAELVELIGWQPRLRQRGFEVGLRETDSRKAYHLAGQHRNERDGETERRVEARLLAACRRSHATCSTG